MRRARVFLGAGVFLALIVAAVVVWRIPEDKPGLQFRSVPFAALPGWGTGDYGSSLQALGRSCAKITTLPADRELPGSAIGGQYKDWLPACAAIAGATAADLPAVLEQYFQPLEVTAAGNNTGVFTGYYEALLQGSETPDSRFHIPLYARPPELVTVDLGRFRADLAGQRIAGSVENGQLVPYANRKDIMGGTLGGRDLEVLWVDSAVDAYFLHVQGSGRVMMPDGRLLGVGYAAQNGHANRLIGKHLIESGAIKRENMSGQAIRAWLADHPEQVDAVLATDPSFVFFRMLESGDGPYGSANVVLTPGHSLAVDKRYLPLHAPVWLSASHPDPDNVADQAVPFNRLMVAQDTGGAINGEIRGDVFWGFGRGAEEIAGRMANPGSYWLLLPKPLAEKAAEQ